MASDSNKKIILVALGICMVCSILVSLAAVGLRPLQKENQRRERLKNILSAGGISEVNGDVNKIFEDKVESVVVSLRDGRILESREVPGDISRRGFDLKRVVADPALSRQIPRSGDLAKIRRMPLYMQVYWITENKKKRKIVLPVYGKGLWSTMYGFIALATDFQTVLGFTFYEHGETPGLGGEIDNPDWQQLWQQKKIYDSSGAVAVEVVRGSVPEDDPQKVFKVDGLSGATLTSRGVQNLVRFWMGKEGYGPFLARLKGDFQDE